MRPRSTWATSTWTRSTAPGRPRLRGDAALRDSAADECQRHLHGGDRSAAAAAASAQEKPGGWDRCRRPQQRPRNTTDLATPAPPPHAPAAAPSELEHTRAGGRRPPASTPICWRPELDFGEPPGALPARPAPGHADEVHALPARRSPMRPLPPWAPAGARNPLLGDRRRSAARLQRALRRAGGGGGGRRAAGACGLRLARYWLDLWRSGRACRRSGRRSSATWRWLTRGSSGLLGGRTPGMAACRPAPGAALGPGG